MADNTNQAAAAEVPADPKASTGAKRIKTPLTSRFVVDEKTTITPEFQEFSATQAKKIQESAKANRVKLIVEPVEK